MKRFSYIVFFVALNFFQVIVYAQDPVMDSLHLAFKKAKEDTTRCYILAAMVETETDDKLWPQYNEQLLTIVETQLLSTSLTPALKKKYLTYKAGAYNNKGFVYDDDGDIPNALEYYHKSLKIREQINDEAGIAQTLNNIGVIYNDLGDITSALEYHHKSLVIKEKLNDKHGISYTLNNIGACYNYLGDTVNSLKFYIRSLKLFEELQDKLGIAYALNNIGTTYKGQNNIHAALDYYKRSLTIYEEINNKSGIAISLNNVATAMVLDGSLSQALNYATKSLQLSKELGFPYSIMQASATLKQVYQKQEKFKEAFEMFELERQMRDSISNQENRKAGIKKQYQYQYEKQAAADSVKHGEEQKVKNAQLVAQSASLKQEQTQRYALYGGLLLVMTFSAFVFNRFRITQKQKQIIEEQKILVDKAFTSLHERNKEVMDSIKYAQRIQRALITSENYIEKQLDRLIK